MAEDCTQCGCTGESKKGFLGIAKDNIDKQIEQDKEHEEQRKSYLLLEKRIEESLRIAGLGELWKGPYIGGATYNKYETVTIDGKFYSSDIDNNTTTPPGADWTRQLSDYEDHVTYVPTLDDLTSILGDKYNIAIAGDVLHGGTFVYDASRVGDNDGKDVFNGWVRIKEASESLEKYPFGKAGMKLVVGEKYDAHYGWGSLVECESSKLVFVYRKGSKHATENGVELRSRVSYDSGATWVEDKILYSNNNSSASPDKICLMGNNRIGFFLNRRDATDTQHNSPLFFYSDNEGDSFTSTEQTTDDGYTFAASSGGMVAFPASQGGDDLFGFITYGYLSDGGLDAFLTKDNGATWSQVHEVATASGTITGLSESVVVRVGDEDKWFMFSRAKDNNGWHNQVSVFTSTNMLDFGSPIDSGLEFTGIPPAALYDPSTKEICFMCVSRAGSKVEGTEQHLLMATADAQMLFDAAGSFTNIGKASYSVVAVIPDWATGYLSITSINNSFAATFTCGERRNGTMISNSAVGMIGDFTVSSADVSQMMKMMLRRQRNVKSIHIAADDNASTTFPFLLENSSGTTIMKQSAYGAHRSGGGAKYTYWFEYGDVDYVFNDDVLFKATGKFVFGSNNIFFGGVTENIDGLSAGMHIGVQGGTFPAIRTYTASAGSKRHMVFHNNNGEVGAIATAGDETSYNTASDPRIKSKFKKVAEADVFSHVEELAGCVGLFEFLRSGDEAIGFNAHKVLDLDPVLSRVGTEGNGGRERDIGSTYVEDEVEETVTIASVDSSKVVPLLVLAVSELIKRLKEK